MKMEARAYRGLGRARVCLGDLGHTPALLSRGHVPLSPPVPGRVDKRQTCSLMCPGRPSVSLTDWSRCGRWAGRAIFERLSIAWVSSATPHRARTSKIQTSCRKSLIRPANQILFPRHRPPQPRSHDEGSALHLIFFWQCR